jgi:lysophospholipase L1-like esterase
MHLVSLGSSFAAGPGLAPLTNTSAKRSSINYPSLLAKSLGARHTDLSVSGATLLNLSSTRQKVFLGEEYPPQVEGVPEDADVVTITGGGNDLGYIGRMMMANASSITKMLGPVIAWVMGHDLSAPPPDEAEMVRRFQAVYDEIHARAPRAQILLVGYPALFGILADETNTPYTSSGDFGEGFDGGGTRQTSRALYLPDTGQRNARDGIGRPVGQRARVLDVWRRTCTASSDG